MTPKTIKWILILLTGALLPACSQTKRIKISDGELEGVVKDGVVSYKGIPFAQPPVGALRWRAPQPPQPWPGVRNASRFGPAPMQGWLLAATLTKGLPDLSEDCLYLNVWTPAQTNTIKRPVLVWIYGGGNVMGSSSFPMYDLARLAQKGVVTVSFNYRLGAFGYLAHPELSQENDAGNYGLRDQIAALRWVKANIAQFGGDADCVTIFGESAGAIAASMLTVVPDAKGLFQRVICQSGVWMSPVQQSNEFGGLVISRSKGEATGRDFFQRLGVTNLAAARALKASDIQKAAEALPLGGFGTFSCVLDGRLLPADSYGLYQAGQFHPTPVLVGFNSDEGAMFIPPGSTSNSFVQAAHEQVGAAAETILKAYPHASPAEAHKATKDAVRDIGFAWPSWQLAEFISHRKASPVWLYYFDRPDPKAPDGASHAAEIPFVLRHADQSAADEKLSELMSSYWINFARTGNPNGAGLPDWPAYESHGPNTLFFDATPSARPLPNQEKLKAVDVYFQQWMQKVKKTEKQ